MDTQKLNLRLIGLSGMAGSGKDTVCEHLVKTYSNTKRIALGDMLRQELMDTYGIPYEKMYERTKDHELSPVKWWSYGETICSRYGKWVGESCFMTYRELMQIHGTDYRRNQDPNYWLNKWKAVVNREPPDTCIVCPDIRFNNELNVIMESGCMLYINSSIEPLTAPHPSEIKLSKWHYEIQGKGRHPVHMMCTEAEHCVEIHEFVKDNKRKSLYA